MALKRNNEALKMALLLHFFSFMSYCHYCHCNHNFSVIIAKLTSTIFIHKHSLAKEKWCCCFYLIFIIRLRIKRWWDQSKTISLFLLIRFFNLLFASFDSMYLIKNDHIFIVTLSLSIIVIVFDFLFLVSIFFVRSMHNGWQSGHAHTTVCLCLWNFEIVYGAICTGVVHWYIGEQKIKIS